MEKYLDRCLSSLIVDDDHMKMFETLIINDGSKDKTSEIGHKYEEKYPESFRVIDKENGHYGSCVNRGLSEASGVFVKILDADDFFDNLIFRSFLDFISAEEVKSNADLILSNFEVLDESTNIRRPQKYESPTPATIVNICPHDIYEWFIHGLTYRTNNLKSIEYKQLEGIPYTDHQWAFEPMTTVKQIYRFDRGLYIYSMGRQDQSVSKNNHFKNLDKEIYVIEYLISLYNKIARTAEEDMSKFLKERLVLSIEHIYQLILLTFSNKGSNDSLLKELDELDEYIKKVNKEIYLITSDYKTRIFKVSCRIIKHWREKSPLLKIEQALYTITDRINQLKSAI